MQADVERFSRVVGHIYDAGADPSLWRRTLQEITDLFGARGASLMTRNVATMRGVSTTTYSGDREAEYWSAWRELNPIAGSAKSGRPDVVESDRQILPNKALLRSEYYQGFLRPSLEVHSILALWLRREGEVQQYVTIGRHPSAGEFESDDIALARLLRPHLQRAVTLGQQLGYRPLRDDDVVEALDAPPHGIVLLDSRGEILHVNRAAEALLAARNGLYVENRRLLALATSRFDEVLARALGRAGETRTGGAMCLPRGSGKADLSLLVVPLRQPIAWLGLCEPAACVCLIDPELATMTTAEWLKGAYGLTTAEITIACQLMDARSPREIGDYLGISYHTVRVHLARIMEKTGTNRQAQLIRLLLSLPGIVGR